MGEMVKKGEQHWIGYALTGVLALGSIFGTKDTTFRILGSMFIVITVTLYITDKKFEKINKRIDNIERRKRK